MTLHGLLPKSFQFRHLAAVMFVGFVLTVPVEAEKPNILLIMADDLGMEGLGCYGGTSYRTPHLDQLASQSLRFTHAFAQPLCTPTRVQLMTGKYNHRNWKAFGILDPDELTFGHHLQKAGYVTGIFGKWQLQSYDPPDFPNAEQRRNTGMHVKDAGFDEYSVYHGLHTEDKGSRYANPRLLQGKANQPGTVRDFPGQYGEDIWVQNIIDFMHRHRDEPAFCYYPMALPHRPFEPTPSSANWNPGQVPEEDVKYIVDMVEYMDTVVGRLLDGLKEKNLLDDTVVLFYSDNGFHLKVNSKLRDGRTVAGGKALPGQNGIHVPLIAYWKGRIKPGVTSNIVDASDFVPTLLDLAGATDSSERSFDGHSFLSTLMNQPGHQRDTAFFWYDPRPGWDKDRFDRSVFALNHRYKMFRDGRLFRLSERPLEESLIPQTQRTAQDKAAAARLLAQIDEVMSSSKEPPLVDAFGEPLKTP